MSWLWGNETTEQAQIVVSALQSELDEREHKIKALEAALRREQQDFTSILQGEVKELEARKAHIEAELEEVSQLIKDKQSLLKTGGKKKKKAKKESGGTTPKNQVQMTENETPTSKQQQPKPKPEATATTPTSKPAADAAGAVSVRRPLSMDDELKKIAKVEPNVAFIIQRSTNANTVVYAGQLAANKQLDPVKPLDVYWIMYEKSDAPREDLNMIERNTAYGVSCAPSKTTRGHFAASLASLKDRDCTLLMDADGNIQARTTINGQKGMVMRRVFVQMTTSWGLPTVDYVEIFGVDPETHAPVYEKKLNK